MVDVDEVRETVRRVAIENGFDPDFFMAMTERESRMDGAGIVDRETAMRLALGEDWPAPGHSYDRRMAGSRDEEALCGVCGAYWECGCCAPADTQHDAGVMSA